MRVLHESVVIFEDSCSLECDFTYSWRKVPKLNCLHLQSSRTNYASHVRRVRK